MARNKDPRTHTHKNTHTHTETHTHTLTHSHNNYRNEHAWKTKNDKTHRKSTDKSTTRRK